MGVGEIEHDSDGDSDNESKSTARECCSSPFRLQPHTRSLGRDKEVIDALIALIAVADARAEATAPRRRAGVLHVLVQPNRSHERRAMHHCFTILSFFLLTLL